MSRIKIRLLNALRQWKSKMSQYISNEPGDDLVQITIDINTDLLTFIQHKAKYEGITEQEVVMKAIKQHVEMRPSSFKSSISQLQKENNPLFQLDGMTKTIK